MTGEGTFTSPAGARIQVIGSADLMTLERMEMIGRRFDRDPRLSTVSVRSGAHQAFRRCLVPGGVVVCIRADHEDLVGVRDQADQLGAWAREASNRGLAHEVWETTAPDVASGTETSTGETTDAEDQRPTSARFAGASAADSETLTIAVDATWLGEYETGAQVLTTSAVAALAEHPLVGKVYLRGLDELPSYARHLADMPGVDLGGDTQADVCWYPNQIDFRSNLAKARTWGKRVITTYLDLIAYDISRYHASDEAWMAYRSLQRTTALGSDGVTTISSDVANRLLEEVPLLDQERVRPVALGLDHVGKDAVPEVVPAEIADVVEAINDRPFLFVLGNDFLHKNRDFAIKVWQELLRSEVVCDLVLAGLHVRSSSSQANEARFLEGHIDLRGRVHTLGHISSDSRVWLLAHASSVLYPSSAEGFGFVPYEAAVLGTPTTFTRFGPLAELTGVVDAPSSWTISEYRDDVRRLIADGDFARGRVETLKTAISKRSWAEFAEDLVTFMQEITRMPIAPGAAVLSEVSVDSTRLNALLASRSWRALAPLRKAGRAFRGRRND